MDQALRNELKDVKHVNELFKNRNDLLEQVAIQKDKLILNQFEKIKDLEDKNIQLIKKIQELEAQVCNSKNESNVSQNFKKNENVTNCISDELEKEKKISYEKDLIIANLVKSKSTMKLQFEERIIQLRNQFLEEIKQASAQVKSEIEKINLNNQKKAQIESGLKNKHVLNQIDSLPNHYFDYK